MSDIAEEIKELKHEKDEFGKCMSSMDKRLALLEQKVERIDDNLDTLTKALSKIAWIISGGFILAAVTWVVKGGLSP